jgi:hypothetical protein
MNPFGMPLALQIVGEISHADFRDAERLLRSQGRIVTSGGEPPELIVVAQSRPGAIAARQVEALRRAAPLAGIVALAGSWCEGETRTGRPWPGVERLYWYEFAAWWRRQLALRAAGRCPDWARLDGGRLQSPNSRGLKGETTSRPSWRGLVSLDVPIRETADALADVLHRAGYATAWQSARTSTPTVRGAVAGVWEGGQLNEREADDLAKACHRLAADGAPVVTLLDFPRRDCVDRALKLGAAVVLGKPWFNHELVATLQSLTEQRELVRAA